MVRLMLVLAPVSCILAGIGISGILRTYMKNIEGSGSKAASSKKKDDKTYPFKNEV